MRRFGKITACLAVALALNASPCAEAAVTTGNPYAVVVARNIFGLLPPPPPLDPNAVPPDPPVKITPTGIMSVSGVVQVLFKVAGKTPGKENFYMLAEGQAQDEIKVVKIYETTGGATFNNHGIIQNLPLVVTKGGASTGSAPVGGSPGVPGNPGVPAAGGNFGSSGFNNTFGGRTGTGGSPGTDNGSDVRPVPTRYGSQLPPMDPAVQTVLIEANRLKAQNDGDPIQKIFPRTELTPPPPDSDDASPDDPNPTP